jgi:death on curing protein
MNHPFVDGNKRVAHAAMETMVVLNGAELIAGLEEQEQLVLGIAAGQVSRNALVVWLTQGVAADAAATWFAPRHCNRARYAPW